MGTGDAGKRAAPLSALETAAERFIFASRWLLAPMYIGLVGGVAIVMIKFFQTFWEMASHAWHSSIEDVTLTILSLLDLALLANLGLIVIFAGYENFVSKIGAAQSSEDRPHWMGHVDFSGLKIKLIGSLVAISVIQLIQDFEHASGASEVTDGEIWRVVLHLTFVISGVLFAVMDWLGDRRIIMNQQHALAMHRQVDGDARASQAVDHAAG